MCQLTADKLSSSVILGLCKPILEIFLNSFQRSRAVRPGLKNNLIWVKRYYVYVI